MASFTREQLAERFADLHPSFTPQAAAIEAQRCLNCFDAPCTAACPTHIDVPGFIKKIATGNLRGSALTILDANILGLSCSRVCPVDVLCEGACVMNHDHRQPIEIARLQRHAMEYFYGHSPSIAVAEQGPKRVACIGAGPASLACAAELRRRGLAVTVFEKNELPGGLNTYGIAEYKLRPADSLKETELIRSMGVEFQLGAEADLEKIESGFDAIFIGVGLGPAHRLGIPGENLAGVIDALRFIADYKAGSVEMGRRVTVIGAGNTAIDAATAARRLGAEEIHILYRRGEEDMPAFEYEYEIARLDGVRFHWNMRPLRIQGSQSVEGIECLDRDGRYFQLACDTVIPAIGQSRLLDFLTCCRGVEISQGRVVVNRETGQTGNPKFFAGGDCVNGGREVVDAVADGKRAARGIAAWLT
ncbi:MAG TPA: NAD(P)-dependent oxidoreductase [Bryobacteraceae bacterium]|nr:NAD(P)-dependent oxidoreductase [Bryobacteraceae bacterium]